MVFILVCRTDVKTNCFAVFPANKSDCNDGHKPKVILVDVENSIGMIYGLFWAESIKPSIANFNECETNVNRRYSRCQVRST